MKTYRVLFLLAVSPLVGRAAYTLHELGEGAAVSISNSAGSITASITTTGFNWSYTKNANGASQYGVFAYKLTAHNGTTTGTAVFDVNPSYATSSSGSYTVSSDGDWYGYYLRIQSGGNTDDYRWQQQVIRTVNTVRLAGTNTKSVAIRLSVIPHGGGSEIAHIDVAAGAAYDQVINLPAGTVNVDVVVYVASNYSNEVWIEQGTITSGDTTTVSSVATGTTGTPTPTPVNLGGVAAPNAPTVTNVNNSSVTWNSTTAAASTTSSTALDKATFREGVDKIVNAINPAQAKADRDAWTANRSVDYATSSQAQGTTASGAIHTLMDGKASFSAGSSVSPNTGDFDVVLPHGGAGKSDITVSVATWDNGMSNMASMIKAIIAWFICLYYTSFVVESVKQLMLSIGSVSQARGNTVAGTGGQVTGLLAAGVLTVIILAAPVALAALFDSGLGWGTAQNLKTALDAIDSDVSRKALSFLWAWWPVATSISAITGYFVVTIGLTAVFTFAMVAMKYVQFCVVVGFSLWCVSDARANVSVVFRNNTANTVTFMVTNAATNTGVYSSYVSASSSLVADFDPAGVSSWIVKVDDDTAGHRMRYPLEVLDGGIISGDTDGHMGAVHPASVWMRYFWLGAGLGAAWEFFAFAFLAFRRLASSSESP